MCVSVCVCMCVSVCMCGWNKLEVCTTLAYPHISSFRTVPVYAHKHTHTNTCILKPFEDSEPTGLKVDIAIKFCADFWSLILSVSIKTSYMYIYCSKVWCVIYVFRNFGHTPSCYHYYSLEQKETRAPVQNQQRRELTGTWKTSHKHNRDLSRLFFEDNIYVHVRLVEFVYSVFTCIPGESYHMWLRSLLLCLCDVFQALINSLVCQFITISVSL